MSQIKVLYVTCDSEQEADTIARALVAERLVACANIIAGMRSLYRWEGKVISGAETILLLKTATHQVAPATDRILSLHSAKCPCVVALDVGPGSAAFLRWVEEEVEGSSQ